MKRAQLNMDHLSKLFGTQDEIRGNLLEVEIMNMRHSEFDFIKELFKKLKSVLFYINMCNTNKHDMVLTILSKLGLDFNTCVSPFHSTRLTLGTPLAPFLL